MTLDSQKKKASLYAQRTCDEASVCIYIYIYIQLLQTWERWDWNPSHKKEKLSYKAGIKNRYVI